jgi:hypothetical protein
MPSPLPRSARFPGLVADPAALEPLRSLVGSTPIGPGRPLKGKPRTDGDAFAVMDMTDFAHIDLLSGTDAPGGDVTKWYDTAVAWMSKNSPPGGVVLTPTAP